MDGLVIYKQYIENIRKTISGYEVPSVKSKGIDELITIVKDIEDICYLDSLLNEAGKDSIFIQEKSFITEPIIIESRLSEYICVGSLTEFMGVSEIYDVEDMVLENCGDLIDITNEINYKNLSISGLGFEEETNSGINLINNYKEELSGIFQGLLDLRNEWVNDASLENPKNTTEKANSTIAFEEPNKVESFILKDNIFECDDSIHTGNSINSNDMTTLLVFDAELEEDSSIEIEEEDLVSEPNLETLDTIINITDNLDNPETIVEEEYNGNDNELLAEFHSFEEAYEDELDYFLNDTAALGIAAPHDSEYTKDKDEGIECDNFSIGDLDYKKKGKIVDSEYVSDIDDVIAKLILAINDNVFKIPNITLDMVGKVKGSGKKIYKAMRVDEEEVD